MEKHHKHRDGTEHVHEGGDVKHDHPASAKYTGKEIKSPLLHYHLDGDDKAWHKHKGGDLEHDHPAEGNRRLTGYGR